MVGSLQINFNSIILSKGIENNLSTFSVIVDIYAGQTVTAKSYSTTQEEEFAI